FTVHVGADDPFDPTFRVGGVRRGQIFRLAIVGKLKPGFHTYPLVGVAGQTVLSKLIYTRNDALVPLWPVQETDAVLVYEKTEGGKIREFDSEFRWTQEVFVRPEATPGRHTLVVTVSSQACDKSCIPFDLPLEVNIDVSAEP